ncbi:hypothetical protein Tco_0436770 [Tanacetum coccineum]
MRQAWFMAIVEFIKGLTDQDHNFFQDDLGGGNVFQFGEVGGNCIEHHNGFGGHTEDDNFGEELDETMGEKSNWVSVKEGDGVLDSEGDGVHLSKKSDAIQQAGNVSPMASTKDHMEIDAENVKDDYTNSQHHLDLLNKACAFKTEITTIDVLVPLNDDDRLLGTMKPNVACDQVDKLVKSSLDDMELEQQPDNVVDKQRHVEQQPNDAFEVKVNEKPCVWIDFTPFKVKQKKCQHALRPNYVLRSAGRRKKKLGMALKPPFGQQSATTLAPKKTRSRSMKTDVIAPPIFLEDISEQPRIWSINHLMTHEPFLENMSDVRVIGDFSMKFYNSLRSVPNCCSVV